MSQYDKINGPFKRDMTGTITGKKGTLLEDVWSRPWFAQLEHELWYWTEKVDGMNMRFEISDGPLQIFGKTERAVIKSDLREAMEEMINYKKAQSLFPHGATIYGEGYGPGINGGGHYGDVRTFIGFDIRYSMGPRGGFSEPVTTASILDVLGIPTVPSVGFHTLREAVALVKEGVPSQLYSGLSEGIVGIPVGGPKIDKFGNRIITKLTHRDLYNV